MEPAFCIKAAKLHLRMTEVPRDEPSRIAGDPKRAHCLMELIFFLQFY